MAYTCAVLSASGRHARGGAAREVRSRSAQARPEGGRASPRRRLWLGRHGDACCRALRRPGPRRHAVPAAGGMGAEGDRRARSVRSGRCALPRLPRRSRTSYDAVSSIGLTEHVGKGQLAGYFSFLRAKLRPEGRLLNHQHHPSDDDGARAGRQVHQSVRLPRRRARRRRDAGIGDAGQRARGAARGEPRGALRAHASRLGGQPRRALGRVGEGGRRGTGRGCGVYMAASRLGFDRDQIELHQVLGVRTSDDGTSPPPT